MRGDVLLHWIVCSDSLNWMTKTFSRSKDDKALVKPKHESEMNCKVDFLKQVWMFKIIRCVMVLPNG